jgi:hypothetical protein
VRSALGAGAGVDGGRDLAGGDRGAAGDQRGEILGDAMVAAALIDRLVHHATMITLKGKNYRLRERGLDVTPVHAGRAQIVLVNDGAKLDPPCLRWFRAPWQYVGSCAFALLEVPRTALHLSPRRVPKALSPLWVVWSAPVPAGHVMSGRDIAATRDAQILA